MGKILITGGLGFLGSALAKKLVSNGYSVTIVDNLSTGSINNLPDEKFKNWNFIKADVNNYNEISAIMLYNQFRFVFHYAAVVGVKRTLDNPIAVLNDIEGIKNILNLSKNTGVKRIFFSSSSEVYGEPVEFPQNEETTPINSKLPYAIVKNVGEALIKSYYREHGLSYCIFRFFNVYGKHQSKDFVVSRFIKSALNNEPIFVYGTGGQTRTFCYIDDNVDAVFNCFLINGIINDTINIGSDEEIPILNLALNIIEATKSRSEIKFLPPLVEGDMNRRKPDISKMKKLLDRTLITIEDGIKQIIENE